MRIVELLLLAFAILGIILNILQIDGGAILMMMSLFNLAFFYQLFGFAIFNGIRFRKIIKSESYRDTNAQKIVLAVFLGFSLSATLVGVLFKLLFWSGGHNMLLIGIFSSTLILAIALILKLSQKARPYFLRILARVAVIGGFALLLYSTPSTTLIDIYYKSSYPEYAELYKKAIADPENTQLWDQLREMQSEIWGN